MPLYEYQCESCSNRFERIQKFSDPLADTCPSCGGGVRKLLSSPAIQFKGAGWYITDYARKPRGDDASAKDAKGTKDKGTETDTKAAKEATDTAKKDTAATSDSSSSPSPSTTTKSD